MSAAAARSDERHERVPRSLPARYPAHGAWPGARYAKPRKVGATVWTVPPSDDTASSLSATRALDHHWYG